MTRKRTFDWAYRQEAMEGEGSARTRVQAHDSYTWRRMCAHAHLALEHLDSSRSGGGGFDEIVGHL
eukprot:1180135-Prorocentrum_minimum.AAC.2